MTREQLITAILMTLAVLTVLVLPGLSMWAAGRIAPLFVKDDESKRLRFKQQRLSGAPFSAWTPLMTAKVTIAMVLGFAVLFALGIALQLSGLMG